VERSGGNAGDYSQRHAGDGGAKGRSPRERIIDVAGYQRHHRDLRLHLNFNNLEPFISEKSAHGRNLDRKLEQARAEAGHQHPLSG
jgi:hypothetical protein